MGKIEIISIPFNLTKIEKQFNEVHFKCAHMLTKKVNNYLDQIRKGSGP